MQRCQNSSCASGLYHEGDCVEDPVPRVEPAMPLPWATAITTVMQELTGQLHPPCTSDALLLAVSIVMEELRKVKDGGEWIDGLPMGTGDYLLKSFCAGSRTRRGGRLTLGYEYDWKHKPAPPLPEAPER